MKTETYLQSARDLKFRIEQLQEERDEIVRAMMSIKSTSDYSERVQTSPQGDGLERKVLRTMERLEKMDHTLIKKIVVLQIRRDGIRNRVCRMKEGQSRRFLIDYYVKCKSWGEIFEEYVIEPDYHIKKRAIAELDRLEKHHSENTDK